MSYFGNLVTMAMSTIPVNLKKIGESQYPLYSTAYPNYGISRKIKFAQKLSKKSCMWFLKCRFRIWNLNRSILYPFATKYGQFMKSATLRLH